MRKNYKIKKVEGVTTTFFDEQYDFDRERLWEYIKENINEDYYFIAENPNRVWECLPMDWFGGYKNVTLGVVITENSHKNRIEVLAKIPAHRRAILVSSPVEKCDLQSHVDILQASFHLMILNGEGNGEGDFHEFSHDKLNPDKTWIYNDDEVESMFIEFGRENNLEILFSDWNSKNIRLMTEVMLSKIKLNIRQK
ncbi:hypothetical protein [Flavobacterium sp.]|uniref:hypothetical protein n=1 Tax=Flavobacterium sp. TaxID=239 RepID=UPI00260CF05B|nr:hypothetical protein [Flavobacterium sp.]